MGGIVFDGETNTLGETMDKHPKAETTGIYEGPDGVRSFIKAENPVPPGYKLVEKVRRLNARPEVIAAGDADTQATAKKAAAKSKGKKGDPAEIETKVDEPTDDKSEDDDIVDE